MKFFPEMFHLGDETNDIIIIMTDSIKHTTY